MIRYRINDRVMQDLKKRSSMGLVFYMILSFLVVTEEGYFCRNYWFSIAFLVGVNGICIVRILHLVLYRNLSKVNEKLNIYLFMATVVITAVVWGLGFSYFLIQEDEYTGKLLMAVCTAGLSAGGVVAFIPERRLSVVFNVLMLLPSAALLVYEGKNINLAVMITLYSVYLAMLTFRGCREYWDALENEYKLSEKTEDLKLQSYTDELTGINNRRFFNEIFGFEWKRAFRNQSLVGIAIGDIDFFKRVNDTHGHGAGDEYLKRIGDTLKDTFKRTTDIVARYGGEEFIILLLDMPQNHMVEKVEELRQVIENVRVEYQGVSIKSTMSLGVAAMVPRDPEKADALISLADKALYNAKKKGRNRVEVSR